MTDHEKIYLEPQCCVDPDYGRQWNSRDIGPHPDCDNEAPWIEYVRADTVRVEIEQLQRIVEAATELHAALSMNGNVIKCHNRLGDLLRGTTKDCDHPESARIRTNITHPATGKQYPVAEGCYICGEKLTEQINERESASGAGAPGEIPPPARSPESEKDADQ